MTLVMPKTILAPSLVDMSKLRISDGVISYRLYGQDGKFIPMTINDTPYNRRFVSWVQIHDRCTIHGSN